MPPGIDIAHICRVIDVGAHGPMTLCRCPRFTRAIFWSSLATSLAKIFYKEINVTKPFPDELLGTFDLINWLWYSMR